MDQLEQISLEVGKVGNQLNEIRTALEAKPNSAELQQTEKRIIDDLVPKLIERQNTELRAEQKTQNEELLAQFDELRSDLARRGLSAGGDVAEWAEYRTAFMAYAADPTCKEAREFMQSDDYQKRALSVGVDTQGGFIVPQPTVMEMQKIQTVIDPIESLARIVEVTTPMWLVPQRTTVISGSSAQGAAAKVAESALPTAAAPAFGLKNRALHKAAVYTTGITGDFLKFVKNGEQIVTDWAAESIGYYNASKYLLGTDVGEPEGIMSSTDSNVSDVTSLNTTSHKITGGDFFKLFTSLKEIYRANASFLFNSTVLYNALLLRADSTEAGGGTAAGAYLIPFSLRDGIPSELAGKKFHICETMANDGTQNNKAVAFGDWKQAYWIAKSGGVSLLRDPYSSKPDESWLWQYWHDGAVVNGEAYKRLKMG